MNTTNLISTPNIEGNIGSCEVKSNEIMVADRVLTSDYKVVQLNSCTGQVVSDVTYTSYGFYSFMVGAGILLGILVFWIVIAVNLDKNNY